MKKRADLLLVEQGLCESRGQAQKMILAGHVRSGPDRVIHKTSEMLDADAALQLLAPSPYVSRGAEKLLPALAACQPDLKGLVGLDIGASTGGFTDALLQYGVRKVYAVDAGYGQLHARLRDDPRVICLERVNARYLTREQVPETVDVITVDVSFISLHKILAPCDPFLAAGGWAFILIKPQFEAQRHEVRKGGVVRDPLVRARCLDEVRQFACQELGWELIRTIPSPITGPKGNQETIAVFRKPALARSLVGCG